MNRLTERDLSRIVKRVINEDKLKNKQQLSESINDYMTLIGGAILSYAGIKLFGKKILMQIFGLFVKGFIKATCYKELENIIKLIAKNPENLKIEYKKIKDYYQIIIDLRVISSEYLYSDMSKKPTDQLHSDAFPAKLKLYDDGTVEYKCGTGGTARQKSDGNLYDEFTNFIKTYGEENTKLRNQDEEQIIFDILVKNIKPNFKSKVDQYNSLVEMDNNTIDEVSFKISNQLDIPQEVIVRAIENNKPNETKDEETISNKPGYSPIWDFISDVYKEIINYNDNESLKESDLTRIVKRVINEDKKETITIPKKYSGVRMELGNNVTPKDIIDMYNELVASEGDSVRLEKYEDGYFWNEFMDDITVDVILDELNYSINGSETEDNDDDEDYEPPVAKTGVVDNNEYVFFDTDNGNFKIIFDPKMNEYQFKYKSKNGMGGGVITDKRMKSLLNFLTKHK